MDYLKDEQHYIDRYDLHTIEECLDHYWFIKDHFAKEKDSHFARYTQEEFEQEVNKCLNLMLFTMKGQRYLRKKETIQEWMDKDRRMQELYDNTPVPRNVLCQVCNSPTIVIHKDLHDSYEPTARMMFTFECTKCKKRQALFEDGTEWKYDPPKCPKCKHALKTDLKIKGDITTFTSTCSKCGYKDKDVSDHKKWREEQEAKEQKDKELLAKYRGEFCLSDEKGKEYIELVEKLKVANEVREEEKQKYDNQVYQRSIQLKKLSVVDLEKLLTEPLEKAKYTKFLLEKPEIGKYVIVPFTVQDADSSRKGYDSSKNLEKLIKTTLEDTNWRLLSGSLSYRLGYVSGQLKGYEQEEDMLELAGKKKEQKAPLVQSEMRRKYEYDNLVQLARMIGKHEGIENMRKRRLESEPDGFLLEANEGPYTCCICHEQTPGDKCWWDLNGIKCVDCQRNVQEGIMPAELIKDDDSWLQDWQLRSDYSIHAGTVRKLRREGLLHGRDLKRQDGNIYCTLYLIKENQEFLKKYPKKSKMKVEFINAGDKKVEL